MKKVVEILQMALLPKIAVLDETDSGLDIDALRIVANGVNELVGPETGALVITHYQRILNYVTPDRVHVFVGGRIVEYGGPELAERLEVEATMRGSKGEEVAAVSSHSRPMSFAGSAPSTSMASPTRTRRRTTSSSPPRPLARACRGDYAEHKNEPDWMRRFRHKSLDYFPRPPASAWVATAEIDFDSIYYYIKPTEKQAERWEDLLADILDTWDKLGIPEAEKKYLAGVGAQYESEVVYQQAAGRLEAQGVLFLDMDSGLREHEDIVKQYLDDQRGERQQVRGAEQRRLVGRLVHLRAAGRPDRDAAAGVLPGSTRRTWAS